MTHSLSRDLRQALRSLLKNPLASLTIILSLGVGMGIATTAFSILNAMALADLPGVREQDRLLTFALSFQGTEGRVRQSRFSIPDLEILQDQGAVFSDVAASGPMQMAVDAGAGPELVEGEVVTASYFRTLGARPLLGRFFTPPEVSDGRESYVGEGVTILSHRYWRARFGEDPDVLGRTLTVNGRPLEIIGVAEEGFTGMTPEDVVDGAERMLAMWVPLANVEQIHPYWTEPDPAGLDARWFMPVGRLAQGVSPEAAIAALPAVAGKLQAAFPQERRGAEIIHGDLIFGPGSGSWRPTLTILGFMVVPIIVLLVACANAANLLLARNASRRGDLAIRTALGASRRALLQELLAESSILALAAGGVGLLVALGARKAAGFFSLHLSMDVPLDWRVFGFTLGASLATGLLFGLVPALRATRGGPGLHLTSRGVGGSGGKSDSRLRDGLVVAQVALGLLLLVSAGLFVRSSQHGLELDAGMDEERLLLLSLDLDLLGYGEPEGRAFYGQLLPTLRDLPGVEEAALAERPPLQGYPSARFSPGPGDPEYGSSMAVARVGEGYLEAAGIPVRAGRSLIPQDLDGEARVAVLNEAAAHVLFPGHSPLGQRLVMAGSQGEMEVVGVAADTRATLHEEARPMIYLPVSSRYSPRATVFIRTAGPPGEVAEVARQAVLELDPRLPITGLEPVLAIRRRLLAPWRLSYLAMGFLGAVAVVLSGAGLYGVLAYTVACRTREIGIRMALGASAPGVVRMVLFGALKLLAAGLAAGFLLSAAVTTLLRGALFGVSPLDPWVYGQVGGLLLAVTVLAALLPAARAASVAPVRAMVEE